MTRSYRRYFVHRWIKTSTVDLWAVWVWRKHVPVSTSKNTSRKSPWNPKNFSISFFGTYRNFIFQNLGVGFSFCFCDKLGGDSHQDVVASALPMSPIHLQKTGADSARKSEKKIRTSPAENSLPLKGLKRSLNHANVTKLGLNFGRFFGPQ